MRGLNKRGESETGGTIVPLLVVLALLVLLVIAAIYAFNYFNKGVGNISTSLLSSAVTGCQQSSTSAPNQAFCGQLLTISDSGTIFATCSYSEITKELGNINADCSGYTDQLRQDCEAKTAYPFDIRTSKGSTTIKSKTDCASINA